MYFSQNFRKKSDTGTVLYNIPLRGFDTPKLWTNFGMARGLKRKIEKYGLAATWLPRYDVLNDSAYVDLLRDLNENQEIGLWLEITSSHAKDAGISYELRRGEQWYWAKHCLAMGYSQDERIKLIDIVMQRFEEIFKRYPQTISMWMIDSFSACYLQEKYDVKTIGLCRNQYGIDGYTLWGGWPNLPYWPSRKYLWQPAAAVDDKLSAIVYPLITEDLIINYGNEYKIWSTEASIIQQQKITDAKSMIDGYMSKLVEFALSMQPVGLASFIAENSWNWDELADTYDYQMSHIAELCRTGKARSMTAIDFSLSYMKAYPDISPNQVMFQTGGWSSPIGRSQCLVACTKNYRARWRTDRDASGLMLTDLRIYDKKVRDPYWDAKADNKFAKWIIPFVFDSSRFGMTGKREEPRVDLAVNLPMNLKIVSRHNQPSGDEKISQLHSDRFEWKNDYVSADFTFMENEIIVNAVSKVEGADVDYSLKCNPQVLDMSIKINDDVFSVSDLPDRWGKRASSICFFTPEGQNAGVEIFPLVTDGEIRVTKQDSQDGVTLTFSNYPRQNGLNIKIRPQMVDLKYSMILEKVG